MAFKINQKSAWNCVRSAGNPFLVHAVILERAAILNTDYRYDS